MSERGLPQPCDRCKNRRDWDKDDPCDEGLPLGNCDCPKFDRWFSFKEIVEDYHKWTREMNEDFVGVLQHLAENGFSISLVNDDNGHWAFGGDGCNNIRERPEDPLTITHFIEGEYFRDTIPEAWEIFVELMLKEVSDE